MAGIGLRRSLAYYSTVGLLRVVHRSVKTLKRNVIITIPAVYRLDLETCGINRKLLSSIQSHRVCWKCESNVPKAEFVCSKCESLQTPDLTINHFQLFNIRETFDVDATDLMNRFKALQRRFHPDKFSRKSKTDQDYSAIYSAQINRAYQTLLKPVKRGLYILEINGRPLKEDTVTMSPEFLMEIMEINEVLEDNKSLDKVKEIASSNGAKMDKLLTKLSENFKNKNWEEAQKVLAEMKYYANIEEKAKNILNEEAMEKI